VDPVIASPILYTLTLSDGQATSWPLREGTITVGRAGGCEIIVQHPSVSRTHARITVMPHGCRIADLGSSNGTFVNGARVVESEIKDGDRVSFGELHANLAAPIPTSATPGLAARDEGLLNQPGTMFWRVDAPVTPSAGLRTRDPQRLIALLSEAAQALLLHGSLSEILGRVVDLAVEHLSAARAVLMLADASGGLSVRVQRPEPKGQEGPPISRTVAQKVMTERVAFLAGDVLHHSLLHQAESVIARRVQSLMCAPLWHEQRVSGILYVEDSTQHTFNAADLEILVSLSNYAAVAIERSQLADQLLAETQRRERLERYHSPAVVERIMDAVYSPDTAELAFEAQERQVTVLFADIVGFTSIAETMPAGGVAGILNEFFAEMTDAVFSHDGTLDKFIGDGLLAVFGAPLAQPDHASRGVAAAIDMMRRLREYNRRLTTGPKLSIRVGVNSGPVVAGDFGSPKRREYTVLGDTVNLASRLQSSVADPGQIVLTRVTLDQLRAPVETTPLGTLPLRGRRQAVEVFAVVDLEQELESRAAARHNPDATQT
jgi:adenylate cyclase